MDASALLSRQGWRGKGHALDRAGRGVVKPLLVSQKSNTLGLGKKKVDVQADQWWARAFDAGLKSLDIGSLTTAKVEIGGTGVVVGRGEQKKKKEKKKNGGQVSELALLANGGGKWLGLYDGFVRGEGLEGTIGRDTVCGVSGVVVGGVEVDAQAKILRREERRRRKEDKKNKRLARAEQDHNANDSAILMKHIQPEEIDATEKSVEHNSKQLAETKKKRKHKRREASPG